MFVSNFVLVISALIYGAAANPYQLHPTVNSGSSLEAFEAAEYKLAWLIDSKNYTAFGEVLTNDVVYDSTDLGAYGGRSEGLEQTVAAIRSASAGARVSHIVTNSLVFDAITPTKWRTDTYITWSHWVEDALDDITKTFRIFYRCDDIWVLQNGAWKLQYSKVYNMGYGAEAPFYGKKS
ncbi:hypothetical protein E4T42_08262 [Aureobasidium subglaciale]|uniref:SnoaL-like domain-containing protein n=1 Tax=Aureobasidium subglaciale (strain EXF-2481) TaxID=1043005 RepID=A0A074YVH0_AURSE|nr:uncharacterized protein AUEXF2481DRAFT_119208 [Aureobasidium subglaciale EXF-2481]KAI5195314.1 hypothetical protein E4T38_09169 [Aureobasidium subglaciale]KAI5214393.1 hypothetical protein E4T40_09043 [Aureobasidium subglaciale]KAI5216965.1 hypothetical protein E4T41_09045 [Aureobasidium subglaciale]KAI5240874.1 hypothetical protein E4T42_08262 [Aureobasidium subglaciale]KAI5253221.1 hypothetical protein E4T46_09663 [Aureobasidium subglaciale]